MQVPTGPFPTQNFIDAFCYYIFLDNWIIPYDFLSYEMTDNGSRLGGQFFTMLCLFLGVMRLMTTAYHPDTDCKVEKYDRTLLQRLCNNVSKPEKDWDTYVKLLTHAYSTQTYRVTEMVPFNMIMCNYCANRNLQPTLKD